MKKSFLIGKKIYLRIHDENDIPIWSQWFNDQEITRFLVHGCFPNTEKQQKDFFKNMYKTKTDFQLAIVDKKTERLIGTIGLHKIDLLNRNADVSIVIGNKKYWKKKIGKEAVALILCHAFNKLNLHKITAGMVEENIASYSLFKSLGFKQEARLREQNFTNGKYQDVIRIGILKSEYRCEKKY